MPKTQDLLSTFSQSLTNKKNFQPRQIKKLCIKPEALLKISNSQASPVELAVVESSSSSLHFGSTEFWKAPTQVLSGSSEPEEALYHSRSIMKRGLAIL